MSHECYTGCHLHSFPCALERIRKLDAEVRELTIENAKLHHGTIQPQWMERLHSPACIDVQTHDVVLKLHGPGPTHAHHNDEPPCR